MNVNRFSALLALVLVMSNTNAEDNASTADNKISTDIIVTPLPHTFGSVMQESMESPLAMFFAAEKAYKDNDMATALSWYLLGAKKMHVPSVENAKHMIQANQGVMRNRSDVIDFLTYYGTPTGIDSGDLFAQLYLADYYSGHNCVWVNFDSGGRGLGEHCLGIDTKSSPVSQKEYSKAYYWYTAASEQGSPRAKYTLGMMDIMGIAGSRNIKKGMVLLEEVAQEGYASSDYILGEMHNQGFWVPQDPNIANIHFSRAAEANLPSAQLALADNYIQRRGISVDESVESANVAEMHYDKVLTNLLSSPTQIARAHYALADISRFQRGKIKPDVAFQHFIDAIQIASTEPNEYSVNAASALGDMAIESDDMDTALSYYLSAEAMLPGLDHDDKKQHASILQRIANIHARGTLTLAKNERLYATYMRSFHNMRASESMSPTQPLSLFGQHAFEFTY